MTAAAGGWQDYLPRARWYAARATGGELLGIEPLDWLSAPGALPAFRPELATVSTSEDVQTYHLLVGYFPPGSVEPSAVVGRTELPGLGSVEVVDVPASPTALAGLLDLLTTNPPAGMRWAGDPTRTAGAVRVSTAEQSNSSAVAGDWLVKVYRQVKPGTNPEPEVYGALAGAAVPRLHGLLTVSGYDLVLISEFLTGARDGWELATAACRDGDPLTTELEDLGAALRQVHDGLASAFGTAATTRAELRAELGARLEQAASELPEIARLEAQLAPTIALDGEGEVATQRVHGDFHLGQALLGPSGWRIVDFEGEPGAPLARRRAFDSRWRDVAGLLRSLDYARSGHPQASSAAAKAWSAQARAAVLAGYGDDLADVSLLRAYEVDRMVYEVGYELRQRPDWLGIPLSAVQDQARRTGDSHGI